MKFFTICFVMLLPSMAHAQDAIYSDRHTKSCLQEAVNHSERRSCVGASANACMDSNSSGSSTYGMGYCLNSEAEWWDGRLNAAYRDLIKREKQDDTDMVNDGMNAPKKAPALRDMQRAWISFRDATCNYEYTQWGGGTGGGPASVSCVLRLTGEQTLYLESAGQGY